MITIEQQPFPYAMEYEVLAGNGETIEGGFETYADAEAWVVHRCEDSGIEFDYRNGQWCWRTIPNKDVPERSWRTSGKRTKEDAARECYAYCGFDQ